MAGLAGGLSALFFKKSGHRCDATVSAHDPNSKTSKSFPQRSGELEAIEVHHLGPRRYEAFHKLLFRVRARIDFRQPAQLRRRTEDQVDTAAGPRALVGFPVAPLIHAV